MQENSIRPSHLFGALGALALGATVIAWSPWSAQAARSDETAPSVARASNVAMNCAPGQQALVRQHATNGEITVVVECAAQPAATPVGIDQQMPYVAPAAAPRVIPAVYNAPAPAPARTYAPRAVRQSRPVEARPVEQKRDWKKDVLVIGGSAGAGAGIGAIAGGKKGAAIGAAIGGGSAALLRVFKH